MVTAEQRCEIVNLVSAYTMTDATRVIGLCEQVERVIAEGVPGAFVECGVWKGGSMMAVAFVLKALGVEDRDLYLFDTFTGMTEPTEVDQSIFGEDAVEWFRRTRTGHQQSNWCLSPLAEVRQNMYITGYPIERTHFVEGMVENTIPMSAPSELALVHLDTDWYKSTKHELVHLYPRVSPGGCIMLDDYGHWSGAKKATDEFLSSPDVVCTMTPCGYSAVILVKQK